MDIPNVYDLSHFNKKTHSIIVSIQYNDASNHLEITYDGMTTIESIVDGHFMINRDEYEMIEYNVKESSIIHDLIHNKKLVGFYKTHSITSGSFYWYNINSDSVIKIYNSDDILDGQTARGEINIYFHKTNIPPFFTIACREVFDTIYPFSYCGYTFSMPFMLFSNDMIEPIPYFDMAKMKYIKQYII